MKLTEKSQEVFDVVKKNGGSVSLPEIAKTLHRSERSVGANVTDLTKKGLATREKQLLEGDEKETTFVVLTDEGKAFVPSDDAE